MKLEARNALLRIAIHRLQDTDTWTLQGRIAGRTADELAAAWKRTRGERVGRKCVVDLVDVTSIDERGEAALQEMMTDGAHFVARGFYTRSLLQSMNACCGKEA